VNRPYEICATRRRVPNPAVSARPAAPVAQSPAPPSGVRAFVTQTVAAFNATGVAGLRALEHPTSVAGIVAEDENHFDGEPCATGQALKPYRDGASIRAKSLAQHKALAAAIKEPLRSHLLALPREQKTGEARNRCKEATGQPPPNCAVRDRPAWLG
jgi:hypothetical protein